MIRTLSIITMVVGLSACSPPERWTASTSGKISRIPELRDCTYVKVDTGWGSHRVIRCPHSAVSNSYTEGKSTVVVTTTDEPTVPVPHKRCISLDSEIYCTQ